MAMESLAPSPAIGGGCNFCSMLLEFMLDTIANRK